MTLRSRDGFALVLTVTLLGLLVLIAYALTALSRVDSQLAATAVHQVQARQNALLGLRVALGELQRRAGPDDRLTGMAGITGIPAGAGNPARHWCGVWAGDGGFLGWLASGVEGQAVPALTGPDAVALAAVNSLGADATDREHVRVRLLAVSVTSPEGEAVLQGRYAYWVADEGVKLSLALGDDQTVVAGTRHAVDQFFTSLQPEAPALAALLAYEQVALAGATTAQRQGGLHSHGRTHAQPAGGRLVAGALNLNSSSARYWSGVAATFNRLRPAGTAPITSPAAFANVLRGALGGPDADTGRAARGPFRSVSAFLDSAALAGALAAGGGALSDFSGTMAAWLSVRSDTFRIRAYGDALNAADPAQTEARACCEAIVQRTPELIDTPAGPFGRRFVVVHFRWLGPEDL